MRLARGVILAMMLAAGGGVLAGCDAFDSLDFLDTKKKLPGERRPVFPEGVPGVSQGIPAEYQKGYNEQQAAQTPDPATTAVQQIAPQDAPKEKPKARQASAPPKPPAAPRRPAPAQPAQQPQAQSSQGAPGAQTAPWPQQAQPQSQPQAQPQAAWPTPPNPNQFSR